MMFASMFIEYVNNRTFSRMINLSHFWYLFSVSVRFSSKFTEKVAEKKLKNHELFGIWVALSRGRCL